jgi:hypothetical protein
MLFYRLDFPMHQSIPNLFTELVLISLLVVVWVAFLTRTVIFVRLELAGIGPLYPASWNPAQRKALENFRLLIGLVLIPTWAAYVLITRQTNTPFEYLEMLLLISMISICYAWTLLLAPRDLRMLDRFPRSFLLMFAFLLLWWGTAFSAVGWMLTRVSAPAAPLIGLPNHAYASASFTPTHSVFRSFTEGTSENAVANRAGRIT